MKKKLIRLTEGDLHRVVCEAVKRLLGESDCSDEFCYSDSYDLGRGRCRQSIIYRGKEIGYLLSIERNWLSPIEEIYLVPDVEYGLQDGWIEFKRFTDYDDAFAYVSQNFDEIVYLFENGDYD